MKHLAAVSTIVGVVLAGALLAVNSLGQPAGVDPARAGTEPVQQRSARSAIELLADVATDTAPAGPTVGELLTVVDVSEILGRDGIFFLTCGG